MKHTDRRDVATIKNKKLSCHRKAKWLSLLLKPWNVVQGSLKINGQWHGTIR